MGLPLFVCLSTAVSFSTFMSEASRVCPAHSTRTGPSFSNFAMQGESGDMSKTTEGNMPAKGQLRSHVDEKGTNHHVLEEAFGTRERTEGRSGPALIMVNYKLSRELLRRVWSSSVVKICADGALNRLYNAFEEKEREQYIPDYVRGDLDSVEDDVKEYYTKRNTKIVKYVNEDTTDLEKCIELLQSLGTSCSQVLVLGAFGGRIDHEFSHYAVLYKYPETNIVLLSLNRAAFLLQAGRHAVHTKLLGPNCGLIPLGEPVDNVQTEGLKWDLHGQAMSMSGLLSTSNRIHQPVVHVSCSKPLLWVCDLRLPDQDQD